VTSVVPLAKQDMSATAMVLARSFRDDPMLTHILPDQHSRARHLPRFLGAVQRYCWRYGIVHTTSDLGGVACWLTPQATDLTYGRMTRAGLLPTVLLLGPRALGRLSKVMSASEVFHHRAVSGTHWYLWLLAADQGRARQGIGSALLSPVLAQADEAQQPVYLETHLETNLGFYERHGFRVVVDEVVDGLRIWGLRRGATGDNDAHVGDIAAD
jgi:ribosomal protein S18 acetylase RimI-like enzyme